MFNMVSGAFSRSGLTSTDLKFYWEDFQAANISQSNFAGFVFNQEVKERVSKKQMLEMLESFKEKGEE